ncbi:hypothetical protein [Neogemmobacter tilapiae]|uniref:Uncharacterized protein n=1 Tax=Neogemmobacter tilapiae TaxID=875041 RepID=A0A918TKM6_9RHOB|nr:hypothetical protein [Gemmobacter tilapiae]GHC52038.1 hypothetical protein GCM10007315_13120 [Gemmobacter tilapiae]
MNSKFFAAVAVGLSLFATQQAQACLVAGGVRFQYIQFADVVVIGKIENYRKIMTVQTVVATTESLEVERSVQNEYVSFDILIQETLRGDAVGRISVVWKNDRRLDPASLAKGSKLIALIAPDSPGPDPSEDVLPRVESELMSVIEPLCALPLILTVPSEDEQHVREMLAYD